MWLVKATTGYPVYNKELLDAFPNPLGDDWVWLQRG